MRTTLIALILMVASVAAVAQTRTYNITANGFNLQASGSFKLKGTKLTNDIHGGPTFTGKQKVVTNVNVTVSVLGNTVTFTDADSYTNSADFGSGLTVLHFSKGNVNFMVFFNQADLNTTGSANDNLTVCSPDCATGLLFTGVYGSLPNAGTTFQFCNWNILDPTQGYNYGRGQSFNNAAASGAVTLDHGQDKN